MATVPMYIEKFQRVVLVDEYHPLAVAQMACTTGAERTADAPDGEPRDSAAATVAPSAPLSTPRRRKSR